MTSPNPLNNPLNFPPSEHFHKKGNNLDDLADKEKARENLGLGSMSLENSDGYLLKNDNLRGLTDLSQAQGNLGLGSAATRCHKDFLRTEFNLSDLTDIRKAQSVLGGIQVNTSGTLSGGGYVCLGDEINLFGSGGSVYKEIRSAIPQEKAITVFPKGLTKNITSIDLEAGTWAISAVVIFDPSADNISNCLEVSAGLGSSATTYDFGGMGDSAMMVSPGPSNSLSCSSGIAIPEYVLVIESPMTVYLNALAVFAVGSGPLAYGRVSAIRLA